MKDRDRVKTAHANKEIVDTTKALIEIYKSAFGDQWQTAFSATVRLSIATA